MPMQKQHIEYAARVYGVHLGAMATEVQPEGLAMDATLAMDALPALVTVSNGGIPAFLTSFVDPKLIEVLTTPNKFAQILGEEKKGDWTTLTAIFPVVESAGETSAYDDYSNNGMVTANVNWPQRQSFHFQTITEWGERQLDMMGKAKIDWSNRLNIASAIIMDKFMNKSYAYGIQGMQNYGLLNDPNLSAPITPLAKAAGGFTWNNATALEEYADVLALFAQLVAQTGGVLEMTDKMTLTLSPKMQVNLAKLTPFNVPVTKMLSDAFPALTVEVAVEYSTIGGEYMQLIADNVQGQDVGMAAFTEKMRAHGVVKGLSSFAEKKSGGTWGAVITQPLGIASMLGL